MNDIKKLIDKYMDGLTTRDEEERLRRYFTSPESIIPADLEWMRALMEWEDTPRPVTRRKHAVVQMLRIAAMLLVVVSIAFALWPRQKSFAIIDGQRVTNREVVQEEALEALNMVSSTDEETFEALFDSP